MKDGKNAEGKKAKRSLHVLKEHFMHSYYIKLQLVD